MVWIVDRVSYWSMPGTKFAVVEGLSHAGQEIQGLALKLRFTVNIRRDRIEIAPDWVADEIVRYANGGVADLTLEEYLAFMLKERAERMTAEGL